MDKFTTIAEDLDELLGEEYEEDYSDEETEILQEIPDDENDTLSESKRNKIILKIMNDVGFDKSLFNESAMLVHPKEQRKLNKLLRKASYALAKESNDPILKDIIRVKRKQRALTKELLTKYSSQIMEVLKEI